jgi:glycosyltransferase involved in cell wall biosynthesis
MATPPVTIGLPVYNGENYLAEAIQSLQAQTFGDFSLIISDNASTDSTEEIIRDVAKADSRIVYHRQETNLGGPANYDFTLHQASSEFFLWHAHDDLRAPEYLEKTHQVIRASEETTIAYTRGQWIDESGTVGDLKPCYPGLSASDVNKRLRAAIRFGPDLMFGLMRRAALLCTGGHGAFVGGDRLTIAEMALLGPFIEIDEPLWYNRRHPERYSAMASDAHGKAQWWNPSMNGSVSFPRWKGLASYIGVVSRSSLGAGDKARCLLSIGRSLLDDEMYHSKLLAMDVIRAARILARRSPRA